LPPLAPPIGLTQRVRLGHLPQAAAGWATDPGERPNAAGQPVLQPEAIRPCARGAVRTARAEQRRGDL